ncbi:transmembrane secretion effector [Micromonospora pisi]|uniref:Transmembrane secretion effector n=1 Tax=Micromonospora pisi TaxID=589240 RepID=A0A495JKP9_9ACTN|nr:MFS transporter [Micromonospora pisi]RKR89235.1 transmembrane secretion effector [Micromonospora pisi]
MRALVSARLGADFTKLWTASAVSNIGDGVTMAAGPLLVASITADPALVAGAVFVQQLPWLIFALISGAYVDRLDRRRLVVLVNALRAVALTPLTLAVATDTVTVALIYTVFFLLGTGETLADTASGAFLPAIVAPERLATANARLMATFTVANQFVAKPLGAWLFVIAAAAPFGVNALTFAVAAALVATIRPVPAPPSAPRTSLGAEIGEGLRWLWRHRLLRTLAVSMGLGNVAFCAAFAVFVLYARQRLGLSDIGYGFLLTTFAVGGLLGTLLAPRLQATFGASALLRTGLIVEVVTHATLAITRTPLVAAGILIVFGIHTMVWGVIVVTLRQRVVPRHLLGRVGSVYALLDLGGAALGSLLGGVLARTWGLTTPFWLAATAMAMITVAAWRPLRESSANN